MSIRTQSFSGPDRFGYLALPGAPTRTGMLVLSTIFGVNEFCRGYADMLAENGIAAAVWDISSGLPRTTDYKECISRARSLTDTGVANMLDEWLTFMRGDPNLTSIGTVGFCIGGRFALLLCAKDKRMKTCVAAYPSIENPRLANQELDAVALSAQIECPVQIVQPGKDHVSSVATYTTLNGTLLKRATAPTDLQYYPVAEHGFMHRPNVEENRQATALAAPQMLTFIKTCLG
jgi:carboxymethylenebutenolidase